MGKWGLKLYQDDLSLDVKDDFKSKYNAGETVESITSQLVEDYECIMDDLEAGTLFWLALADTQWEFGVLMPSVQERALCQIQKCRDALDGQAANAAERAQWEQSLNKWQAKLLSPLPPVKKRVKRRIYKCQWQVGDVFAYQMESDLAKERGLYGRYLLIQKVDEGVWYPGHIVPIVYVKLSNGDSLPATAEEYDRLEYIQTSFTKYEYRFCPINMRHPQEDIAEKSKIDYQVDEYGFLPEYRVTLLNTSKKVIPAKLIHVSCFTNTLPPPKEFVQHDKINILAVGWKEFDETFETRMIKRYCGHNLRENSIYKKQEEAPYDPKSLM